MEEKVVLSHIEHQIELFVVELFVLILRKCLFDLRHAGKIAQEVGLFHGGWVDAFVAELAEESSVAVIKRIGDTSQVRKPVVRRAAVDVIHRHALGDRPPRRHPDGVGDVDVLVMSESVFEFQIPVFSSGVVRDFGIRVSICSCIDLYGSTVGIDPHAVVVGGGTIERDARFRARAYVVHADVVVVEGMLFVCLSDNSVITHISMN